MQSVRWITFGVAGALTKTVVHFYPSSGNVTAPYPAHYKLTIFGLGLEKKSVVVEGARLSQPDGVRVEDVFPVLKGDFAGLFGLKVEISTVQPRIDLSGSLCIMELCSRSHSARFWPKQISEEHPIGADSGGLVVADAYNTSSVIIVNPTDHAMNPELKLQSFRNPESARLEETIKLPQIHPESVHEVSLSDCLEKATPQECTWGLSRLGTLRLKSESKTSGEGKTQGAKTGQDGATFILYRDVLTKRPFSVFFV